MVFSIKVIIVNCQRSLLRPVFIAFISQKIYFVEFDNFFDCKLNTRTTDRMTLVLGIMLNESDLNISEV